MLLLTSCSWITKPPVKVFIKAPLEECLTVVEADSLELRDVEYQAFVHDKTPYICTDVDNYRSLALNQSDILTHIRQKNLVEKFYKDCINRMIEHQKNFGKEIKDGN